MEVSNKTTVVALRRFNPGYCRGNRPALEPIFVGDKIDPRWNLIAPPAGEFRISILSNGDYAYSREGHNNFVGHEAVAKDREVLARETTRTPGLKEKLLELGLVS